MHLYRDRVARFVGCEPGRLIDIRQSQFVCNQALHFGGIVSEKIDCNLEVVAAINAAVASCGDLRGWGSDDVHFLTHGIDCRDKSCKSSYAARTMMPTMLGLTFMTCRAGSTAAGSTNASNLSSTESESGSAPAVLVLTYSENPSSEREDLCATVDGDFEQTEYACYANGAEEH
ncbi:MULTISPECIES: hypothetical protein [Paraburkholderia]|uniref:hypothetical protein n=1 Tax=Paraburkholderia TaxID=1822464 RepID=UPI002259CEF0|nr:MULTISPECIES: hypothetical protein [Paraburkholderia]MCX4157463.1 hypothetical protein [Paraburkholderia aspalathi]MDN7166867.1 hypothetical protein [Paraburkholderia sp. SECH2]MDQ6395353.1 hypothetical protein [Paraburkholderia aspalathi]